MKQPMAPAGLAVALIAAGLLFMTTSLPFSRKASSSPLLSSRSRQDEETKQYLTKWLNELAVASVHGDVGFFENFMADDYEGTTTNGVMKDKAQWLADYRSQKVKFLSHVFDHIVVRVYGETAVVTNGATAVEILKGNKRVGRTQNLRAFVKREGRWQCVAFQSTVVRSEGGQRPSR